MEEEKEEKEDPQVRKEREVLRILPTHSSNRIPAQPHSVAWLMPFPLPHDSKLDFVR